MRVYGRDWVKTASQLFYLAMSQGADAQAAAEQLIQVGLDYYEIQKTNGDAWRPTGGFMGGSICIFLAHVQGLLFTLELVTIIVAHVVKLPSGIFGCGAIFWKGPG